MEAAAGDPARSSQAPVELIRALAVLAEPPGPEHRRVAGALDLGSVPEDDSYVRLFQFQLYPYASVYLGPEGMLGGEARSRISGFWGAVGRTPPPEPDHVSALLGLYVGLMEEGGTAEPARAASPGDGTGRTLDAGTHLARTAAVVLLHEHLAPWCLPYLARVRALDRGFYGRWAELLEGTLAAELGRVGAPEALPVHLREAPGLPDPRTDGATAFLEGLLAPVRTGMIVTRADLAALAAGLKLGMRVGERRYILEHLLAQEAEGVLSALSAHAARAARGHDGLPGSLGVSARFWQDRAAATASLLDELARHGGEPPADEPPPFDTHAAAPS